MTASMVLMTAGMVHVTNLTPGSECSLRRDAEKKLADGGEIDEQQVVGLGHFTRSFTVKPPIDDSKYGPYN
jgi:hypothetical protein